MKTRFTERNDANKLFVRALFCVLLLALAIPFATLAQQYSGTITGTVTDPTGAAVAGAAVTARNLGTNATYNSTTSDQGGYSFAQLPVGTYEIQVKQGSFKEFIAKGVEVHVSTSTEVNARLEVGAVSEMVTVEASAVQVQTANAEIGEVVDGTQVRELPLNGENFMNLVTLSPGVSTAQSFDGRDKGLTGGSDFSVNGNPYTNNLFLVDGVNNNDVGSNRTILVYPSVDAIAEFKMIRNSYGPEYGQASGAIISITTRSGQNQFHGGAFYAGRNDKLDANDWFSNFNNTGKAELRRNDWGYNASGPILKDKLFVFWNQEWNREVRGESVSACVPTVAEKAGDFTADAAAVAAAKAAGASNPGNAATCGATVPNIPVALQAAGNPFKIANPDATAQLIAQFYPNPNVAGVTGNANNWADSERTQPSWSEWNIRTDYDLTKKNRITFRWTNDSWTSPSPNPNLFWGSSFFPTINSDWSQPSKSVMAKLTTQLSSTMVNDVEFGYGHNAIITTLASTGASLVAQINAAVPTAWPSSLKQSGAFLNGGANWGGLQPYGSGQTMWNIAPYGNHEDLYAVQDNISKVHGNHLFKVGAYYSTNAKIEFNNGGNDQPGFNASNGGLNQCPTSAPCTTNAGQPIGIPTGNQLANLLIPGQEFISSENSVNGLAQVIWHDFEWYVGDTWKFRRNLTLSYGFRWSFFRQPYASDNHWASFSLAAYNPALPPSDACNGVIIVPGTTPCQNASSQLSSLGISLPLSNGTPGPNSALVNQNNHDIAPRLGLAWDVKGDGKTAVRLGIGQFMQRAAVGQDEGLARTAPFVISAQDIRTLEVATPLSNPSVSPSSAEDPTNVTPNSWQWNVSVERELARNTTLELGYIGNTGVHLVSVADLNAVPQSNWLTSAFESGSTQNLLRPAGNFGTIAEFAKGGHSSYHSLQALFRSRLSNFSSFQASYTYSHSIADEEFDNSSGGISEEAFIDPANPKFDKGNSSINRPQIFVANEVFYLPKFAKQSNFVQESVGGWEFNSIISVESGPSVGVFSNGANGACAQVLPDNSCAPGFSSNLTSLTGNGYNNNNRPDIVAGVGCNSGVSGRQILNPAAFTLVGYTIGTVGNAPHGYCHGPDNRNVDMQLAKNWTFKEKYRIKFSMDFFNVFNHANFFGGQNGNLGINFSGSNLVCGGVNPCSATNNVVTGQTGSPNGAGSGFGQATSVHPGRELQYTLKFVF
jgi:hypothetical protein